MSSNFDWKTEDDFDWDKLAEDPPSKSPPGKGRRWLAILAIVLLIGGVAAYLMHQVNQRVDENTQAMRSDVVSSYNLLHLAEEEQDDELFFSLLSGRDGTWTAAQHALFQAQSLSNRAPFGLQARPVDSQTLEENDSFEITFSPDLLTADVATLLPYEIKIGNGLTEIVTLQETVQYRLGRERWLLSPPDQEFWGPQELQTGARIELIYPQRDEELAKRLHLDLDRKLDELCGTLVDIECDSDLLLRIKLSTDPQTLVDAAQPHAARIIDESLEIALPAPTLVGIPQDEDGYQAIFRGYAAQMVTAVISQQIGYECCDQLPIYQALIDYQLSQLALKPWPVGDADYGQILSDQVRLEGLSTLWRSDDPQVLYGPDGWRVYVVVDYLLDILPDYNAAVLQRELVRRGSFRGWLNGLFAADGDLSNSALIGDLTRGFWMRGYTQTFNTSSDWDPEPPAQNLTLTCTVPSSGDEDDQVTTLYQYDIGASVWDEVYETSSFLWTASLPGDDILLQQEYSDDTRQWTTAFRQKDQLTPLLPTTEDHTVSFGQTDPTTAGLAAFVFPPDSDEATITWFGLHNCQESSGCSNMELPGIPIWSPDGERALFTDDPNSQIDLLRTELRTVLFNRQANNDARPLYVGDRSQFIEGQPVTSAKELSPAGIGHAPFWIDNNTVGYVTGEGDPIIQHSSRVMFTAVDQNNPKMLFSLSDLTAEIEGGSSAFRLFWIHYVMVHPDNPDQLFVVVLSTLNRRAYVLTFDRTSNEVRHLMSSGFMANHSLGLSPDGRYLILTGTDENDPHAGEESVLLQIYDLTRQEILSFLSPTSDFPPFSTYDWSLEGNWLALLLDDNTLGFFAPDQKQLHLIETPPGDCGTPAWINR